jgi:putative ABC transport system substrate-binding protein
MFAALIAAVAWGAPRVLVVQSDDYPAYLDPVPAFLAALDEPARVVNLHGREAESEGLQRRLRDAPPRVVFALGAKAAWTVRQGNPELPMVYTSVMQPERYGVGGGQGAGIDMSVRPVQYLAQVKAFLPQVERVLVLRGPTMRLRDREALIDASRETGVELVYVDVSSPRQVRPAFTASVTQVDALWLRPDREFLTTDNFRWLVEETRRHNLPLLVETDNMVRAGGSFAVTPDLAAIGVQAAVAVRALLDGQPPPDAEAWPAQALVSVNLRAMEQAEVEFDWSLIEFVDRVVE